MIEKRAKMYPKSELEKKDKFFFFGINRYSELSKNVPLNERKCPLEMLL